MSFEQNILLPACDGRLAYSTNSLVVSCSDLEWCNGSYIEVAHGMGPVTATVSLLIVFLSLNTSSLL